MTKVYSLTRKYSAYYETKYCGVVVQMPFTIGAGNGGERRSEFVTNDKFTQDAIEHDPRFNHDFYLSATVDDETGEQNEIVNEPVVQVKPVVRHYTQAELDAMAKAKEEPKEEPKAEPVVADTPKPRAKRSRRTVKAEPELKVFPNINDAIYYMENELGVEVDEDNVDEQLKQYNLALEA